MTLSTNPLLTARMIASTKAYGFDGGRSSIAAHKILGKRIYPVEPISAGYYGDDDYQDVHVVSHWENTGAAIDCNEVHILTADGTVTVAHISQVDW